MFVSWPREIASLAHFSFNYFAFLLFQAQTNRFRIALFFSPTKFHVVLFIEFVNIDLYRFSS